MKKILFIRNNKAYLPEVDAYIKYFNKSNNFEAFDSSKLLNCNLDDYDVLWEFKGVGGIRKNDNQILVHEYSSLSTGKLAIQKNFIKSTLNSKPDFRIFLNESVKNGFHFNDDVDYCFRDMGVDERFVSQYHANKEFDFLYVGSISKAREIDKLLKAFTTKNNGKLCLIGSVDSDIYHDYKDNAQIIFMGKVPYYDVPKIAAKAEYGINFIPDKYPFNIQTSTKLLEYLALGLKVITTDYKWIRDFEKKHNSLFYKLDTNNLMFCRENIIKFKFESNFNAEEYLWENIIANSKIEYKIDILFNKLNLKYRQRS